MLTLKSKIPEDIAKEIYKDKAVDVVYLKFSKSFNKSCTAPLDRAHGILGVLAI